MKGLDILTDAQLLARCERLAKAERAVSAEFIACLAEVDRRRAHEEFAYGSLFDYCVRRLKMSDGAAGRRVAAARAARKRMECLSYLKDGSLSLWALGRLEPYLQRRDGLETLSRAASLDRAGLEMLILELAQAEPEEAEAGDAEEPSFEFGDDVRAPSPVHAAAPDRVVSSAAGRIRISFEASSSLKEKLERTGTLLAHRLRSRRMEELIEALADLALRELDPSRKTGRARPVKGNPRRVPGSVRRQVWERDGGRCAYAAADGTRCGSRSRLQYDHVQPWALGGRSDDAANIRLLCRAHNLHLARKTFGDRVPAGGPAARAR